jgi:nucleoside triphosphate pyrophosphatase
MAPIILASASPSRIALLTAAAVPFTSRPAPIDERMIEAPLVAAGAGADHIAADLAKAKALAVGHDAPEAIVIGADQTLELDGRLWAKPRDLAEARAQLTRLSGRTHVLHTAAAAARHGAITWRESAAARLTMRPLTAEAIEAHLARVGEAALTSVGAYQIEGPGIRLFDAIEGDYFAILGLPLLPLIRYLRAEGAID